MECKPLLMLASGLKFKTITITEIAPRIHNLKYGNFDISIESVERKIFKRTAVGSY